MQNERQPEPPAGAGGHADDPYRGRDIERRAFAFALRVVKLASHLQRAGMTGQVLGRQLLRAGTSVGANLEEACAGQSRADFIAKVSVAQKEIREAHYWLRLIGESEVVPDYRIAELQDEAEQLCRIITAIARNAKQAHQATESPR